jgi:hypothetical protein
MAITYSSEVHLGPGQAAKEEVSIYNERPEIHTPNAVWDSADSGCLPMRMRLVLDEASCLNCEKCFQIYNALPTI